MVKLQTLLSLAAISWSLTVASVGEKKAWAEQELGSEVPPSFSKVIVVAATMLKDHLLDTSAQLAAHVGNMAASCPQMRALLLERAAFIYIPDEEPTHDDSSDVIIDSSSSGDEDDADAAGPSSTILHWLKRAGGCKCLLDRILEVEGLLPNGYKHDLHRPFGLWHESVREYASPELTALLHCLYTITTSDPVWLRVMFLYTELLFGFPRECPLKLWPVACDCAQVALQRGRNPSLPAPSDIASLEKTFKWGMTASTSALRLPSAESDSDEEDDGPIAPPHDAWEWEWGPHGNYMRISTVAVAIEIPLLRLPVDPQSAGQFVTWLDSDFFKRKLSTQWLHSEVFSVFHVKGMVKALLQVVPEVASAPWLAHIQFSDVLNALAVQCLVHGCDDDGAFDFLLDAAERWHGTPDDEIISVSGLPASALIKVLSRLLPRLPTASWFNRYETPLRVYLQMAYQEGLEGGLSQVAKLCESIQQRLQAAVADLGSALADPAESDWLPIGGAGYLLSRKPPTTVIRLAEWCILSPSKSYARSVAKALSGGAPLDSLQLCFVQVMVLKRAPKGTMLQAWSAAFSSVLQSLGEVSNCAWQAQLPTAQDFNQNQ